MSDKQYGHDDARDYEPYFSRHMMAMTAEDLHSKGEIACELAYRDARIAELEARELGWLTTLSTMELEKRELEAENQRLRDGIANAMLCDSVVQMHECLAALLGGGE